MEPGDVSDIPIRYAGNWYILRRGESVPKTFEEAKPELMASARNRKGYSVAASLAERAQSRLKETKDPQKVAQELAAEANMKPAEMVQRDWIYCARRRRAKHRHQSAIRGRDCAFE